MAEHYDRAPVTEAVIEFRVRETAAANVEKAHTRIRKAYPRSETLGEIQVRVGPHPTVEQTGLVAYKLSSDDATKVVTVRPNGCSVSRLAPYERWEELFERTQDVWSMWKKATSATSLTRLGVRFINRIDVPVADDGLIDRAKYLKIGPKLPKFFDEPERNFSVQEVTSFERGAFTAILNCGTGLPAILNHGSLVLDIDVGAEIDLPRNDDDIWKVLSKMRDLKNGAFEACITARTRSLIR